MSSNKNGTRTATRLGCGQHFGLAVSVWQPNTSTAWRAKTLAQSPELLGEADQKCISPAAGFSILSGDSSPLPLRAPTSILGDGRDTRTCHLVLVLASLSFSLVVSILSVLIDWFVWRYECWKNGALSLPNLRGYDKGLFNFRIWQC